MPDPLDLLAPSRCLACARRGPVPWCAPCADSVRPAPVGCPRCAGARAAAHACWPQDAPIDATVAAFDYRGPVAAGIAAAKLRGARSGWPALAAPLAARLVDLEVAVDAVTYVTTPTVRTRERGGDHAAGLARTVAGTLQVPAVRLLDAVAGSGGDRYRARRALPGSDLLLIDDVVTTGATAWRAAAALRRAGAGRITLAVLARAGTHPLGAVQR